MKSSVTCKGSVPSCEALSCSGRAAEDRLKRGDYGPMRADKLKVVISSTWLPITRCGDGHHHSSTVTGRSLRRLRKISLRARIQQPTQFQSENWLITLIRRT